METMGNQRLTKYQANMTQIFGDYDRDLPSSQEGLTIVFSPTSAPLKKRWRNNGLSADFMADYFATFFPGGEAGTGKIDIKAEIKSAVGFIANELLENAMKFNDEASSQAVGVQLQMHKDRLVFLTTNSIHPQAVPKFQAYIHNLITNDPGELYIRHLEKSAEEENQQESGLGLLTMLNDYQAKIGWKFERVQEEPEAIVVTTMVQLML